MDTPEQWNTAIKSVLIKASTDAEFREKCLTGPAAATLEASGFTAPALLCFSESADGKAVVLPPFGADPEEITNSEILGDVAGGAGSGWHFYNTVAFTSPSCYC